MKIRTAMKPIAILIISLFLAGTTQIGFSSSVNNTELNPQTAETRTSFDPFMEGWAYRKQITIDNTKVASDLTDFPVFISITDSNLQTKAQSDGDDILFMDGIGIGQQLNHEIENYDSSTGELVAWVNIPSVSATTDTIFYMYYGNTECNSQQHGEDTWDPNFVAVWHMNDASLTTIADSTSYGYTGTKIAPNGPQQAAGKIGSGQDFDGTDDCIDYIASIIPTGPKTISVWMKKASDNPEETMFASSTGGSWNDQGTATYYKPANNGINWYMGNGGTSGQFMNVYVPIPDRTEWHLYTMIYDGSTLTVFTDAASPLSNTTKSGTESNPTYTLRIGKRPIYTYCPFHGTLDEIKISNIARSYEYIATEYNNQNEPSTFLTFGPEETIPFVKTIMFGKITNLNTGDNSMTFNAVKLRSIRFSPFSFITYISNERLLVSNDYRGLISQTRVLVICQVYP